MDSLVTDSSTSTLLALIQHTESTLSDAAFKQLLQKEEGNVVEDYLAIPNDKILGEDSSIRNVLLSLEKGEALPEHGLNLNVGVAVLMSRFPDRLSIETVVSSLLRTKGGHKVVSAVVGIAPWTFRQVAVTVCEGLDTHEENAAKMILQLVHDFPHNSIATRSILCSKKCGTDVALLITLKYVHDEFEFLSKGGAVLEWLYTNIKRDGVGIEILRERLIGDRDHIQALKIWCNVWGVLGVGHATEEEISACMSDIMAVAATPNARWAVCAMILCPHIVSHDRIVEAGGLLLSGHGCADAVLVANHLMARGSQPITLWLSRVLDIPITVNLDNLKDLYETLVVKSKCWDEGAAVNRAVRFPVQEGLNADNSESNALVMIFHLLRTGAFMRHQCSPASWILRQILASTVPINPLLAATVDLFSASKCKSIPRLDILKAAQNPDIRMASRALLLYHMLRDGDRGKDYNAYNALGIGQIVAHVLDHPDDYQALIAVLVGKVVTHMPESLIMNDEPSTSAPFPSAGSINEMLTDSTHVDLVLDAMRHSARNASLVEAKDAITVCASILIPRLLSGDAPACTGRRFTLLWQALVSCVPGSVAPVVSVVFVRLWKLEYDKEITVEKVANALARSPLSLLKCDRRVFRCPSVLGLWLHVFEAVLAQSHRDGLARSKELGIEYRNAINLQSAAAVQMLLDACREVPGDEDDRGTLSTVRYLICSYIHTAFIKNEYLCYIVHNQGYSTDLLPMTVRGVPSMHVCLKFLPELIDKATTNKLVFYVMLAAEIAKAYPIPGSLAVCQQALTALSTVTDGTLRRAVRGLRGMCQAFPALLEPAVKLLCDGDRSEWRKDAVLRLSEDVIIPNLQ